MIKKEKKAKIVKKFARGEKDTGSPEVQIAIISERIIEITAHLKDHPNDKHSRRGLLGLVTDRRKLLKFLEAKDKTKHTKVVKALKL